MFCPNCGANNPDTATVCPQCNQPIPQFSSTPRPPQPPPPPSSAVPVPPGTPAPPQSLAQIPNYMTQSIILLIVSILCCGNLLSMALAIVALVYSTQVNGKVAANDIAGAMDASKNAKLFNWIAFGLLIAEALIVVVWGILIAMGVATNIWQQH